MDALSAFINNIFTFVIKLFSESYNYIGFIGLLSGATAAILLVLIYLFFKKKMNSYLRAVKQYEKGNLEKSRILLRIELNKNPSNRKALQLLADIECYTGDFSNAEKDYYRLIDLKKPGDDIDIQIIRKKLLEPLYRQEKLSETLNIIILILSQEKTDPQALYYLSLLYIGQLYYQEAEILLEKLIRNRPKMSQALFAYSVTLAQNHKYERSIQYLKRAIEIEENPVYMLCLALVYYLTESYSASKEILAQIKFADRVYSYKQYSIFLRLDAFVLYMLGSYMVAEGRFKRFYEYHNQSISTEKPQVKVSGTYNEFGRKIELSRDESVRSVNKDSELQDYFRLKEVAFEQNRSIGFKKNDELASSRFLEIEGLTTKTWAALDYGFCMIKSGELNKAREFFLSLKKEHPEILGLKELLRLISEKIKANRRNGEGYFKDISNSTEKVITRGKRKYELWEYITTWEKNAIRPYHLLMAGGFTTRKQLNPVLLYRARRFFDNIG